MSQGGQSMNRKSFTKPLVESDRLVAEAKKSSHGRVEVRDRSSRLVLRVTRNGARGYITRPRLDGRPIRLTYGGLATWENYSDAKAWADRMAGLCRQGVDPREEQRKEAEAADRMSIRAVAVEFVEKYAKKNRTWKDTEGILNLYVLPRWGDRLVTEVTKEDVARLLNKVEARASVYRRNRVLACIRKLFNWAVANYDELNASPVVKGMAGKGEEARTRYLRPEEIRAVWRAADRLGYPFGRLVQMLLATGQRRGEVVNMTWGRNLDVDGERLWTLDREETKAKRDHWVPLSDLALEVLDDCPRIDGSDLFFTTNGSATGRRGVRRHAQGCRGGGP
jgi:integrase